MDEARLRQLAESVRRECRLELDQKNICILATVVTCDTLLACGIAARPVMVRALLTDTSRIDNADGTPWTVLIGSRTNKGRAGHWVTIVQRRWLIDTTLNQAKTIDNLPPVVLDVPETQGIVRLSDTVTVRYAPRPMAEQMDISTSTWVTRTNPRRRIAQRLTREFKPIFLEP